MDEKNKRNSDDMNAFEQFDNYSYSPELKKAMENSAGSSGFFVQPPTDYKANEHTDTSMYVDESATVNADPAERPVSLSNMGSINVPDDTEIEVLLPDADEEAEEEKAGKKKSDFFTRNNGKNKKIIAIIVAAALVLTAGGIGLWIYFATKSDGYGDKGLEFLDEKGYLSDEVYNFNNMGDTGASSLNDFLFKWANNAGDKMHDKNIINVLLCGVDNGDSPNVASDGRSDTIMLVSVDKKNKKITLTSFFRDTWTYMRIPKSDGTYEDAYNKINAAYIFGGPATLIETIENDYKIEIDQYIAVDFKSFPKLIDAVGGVTVDVQEYEANYIRRTSSHTNFPYGKNTKLNGKQALIFSRIRHSDNDGDISRTRRQRSVIKALIESAKTATNGQLVNAFKQVSNYMRTGYKQSEVIKLIAQATSHDWMEFPMTEITIPNEDGVDSVGGYIGSQWAWAVDLPVCAQKLQKAIYGKTNIKLEADRLTVSDYLNGRTSGTGSSDSNSGSSSGGGYYSGSGGSSGQDTTQRTYNYIIPDEPNGDDNSGGGSSSGGGNDSGGGSDSGGDNSGGGSSSGGSTDSGGSSSGGSSDSGGSSSGGSSDSGGSSSGGGAESDE